MRIEILEKRENFIKITKNTLKNSTFFNEIEFSVEQNYYLNKYLNFIASENLPDKVFQILVNEYSSSLNYKKKLFQYLYVKLSISSSFRKIFSHETVLLPAIFNNYLILGGNHRLRLFSTELTSTHVLLKFNERNTYILNDIALRNKFNLPYAPKILNFGKDWIEEEYFEGTPINRLRDEGLRKKILKEVVLNHEKLLILKSVESVSKEVYIFNLKKEIDLILYSKRINVEYPLIELINKTFNLLKKNIKFKKIDVSWSHGDFHQANILVRNKSFRVIDWEASDKRFYLYDYFILMSGLRVHLSIEKGVNRFYTESRCLINKDSYDSDTINLLLLEELRFNINEQFSVNFFKSGFNTSNLCHSVLKFLEK